MAEEEDYSRRQLDRMRRGAPTVYRGQTLPSLQEACAKRKLRNEGSEEELRRRLKRFKARREDMEPLQCPICSEFCSIDEIVLVCENDHHVCFECALGLARQPAHRHACPMRCDTFQFHEPSHLLRRLAQPLVQDVAPSGAFQMYRKLVDGGVVPSDMSVDTLRFMGVVHHHSPVRALAQRAYEGWLRHLDLMHQLNTEVARHTPRHIRFDVSSSDEEEETDIGPEPIQEPHEEAGEEGSEEAGEDPPPAEGGEEASAP